LPIYFCRNNYVARFNAFY